jgi:hypothetical protein
LDVQQYRHLKISASSTEEFKLWIAYKVGTTNPKTVFKSADNDPCLFPATKQAHTNVIPARHNGKIDQIALIFYEKQQKASVNFTSCVLTR